MDTLKRICFHLLLTLPGLGLLVNRLQIRVFNSDEFQHTYLAWAPIHFNQSQYIDIWDNHGPVYSFINSIFIRVADLQAGVETIVAERYLNLFILILGFLVLFELFHLITAKAYHVGLGIWIFAASLFSSKAIEVRPDHIQCFFLYLGLFLLIKAIKDKHNKLAFYSGVSFVFMLMSNLKSLSALAGVLIALVLLKVINKVDPKILWSWLQGFALSLLVFISTFALTGSLEGYVNYNILFNKYLVAQGHSIVRENIINSYKNLWHSSILVFAGMTLVHWFYQSCRKLDPGKLILIVTITTMIIPRFSFPFLWMQYELLFMPLLACLTSWLMVSSLENHIFSKIRLTKLKAVIIVLLYISFLFSAWQPMWGRGNILAAYHSRINKHIDYVSSNLKQDEHIEIFTVPFCKGHGFAPQASPLISKFKLPMTAMERLMGRELYGQDYIDLLNKKKVKFIIGPKSLLEHCKSKKTRRYIRKHYGYADCLWTRRTSFEK